MDDSDPSDGLTLAALIGAVVTAFIVITPLMALLLGLNWTQAVLVGGAGSVIAAASAALTARRSGAG